MTKMGVIRVVFGVAASIGLFVVASGHSATGIPDPCISTSYTEVPGELLVCPVGDGGTLGELGAVVHIRILDSYGDPIPTIPATDFWLAGCYDGLELCPPWVWANSVTNSNGETTISGAIRAGGCDNGLVVYVQGVKLVGGPLCAVPQCLPIRVRSPDFNRDLVVDLIDLSRFARSYLVPTFEPCVDLNFDGVVDIIDFSIFAQHYLHECL
jgi:hypothetical protein